jgi:hypothetical protein
VTVLGRVMKQRLVNAADSTKNPPCSRLAGFL